MQQAHPSRPTSPTSLRPVAAAIALAWMSTGSLAWAQPSAASPAAASAPLPSAWDAALPAPQLQASPMLQERIDPAVREQLPVYLQAEQVLGQPDIRARLEGNAELRRGDTVIRASDVEYTLVDDTVQANGNVHINRAGDIYQGSALQLQVDAFQGDFKEATYQFLQTGGHGDASRVEFLNPEQSVVHDATYTTCLRDDSASWQPDWVLRAETIELDRAADVGIARNGALEFKGVPILPVPAISFPLSDKRKSGLLPPTIGLDSNSGLEYAQPYYWNIAPNRDATITPTLMTKRGVDLGAEFRYLESGYHGQLDLNYMPDDRLRNRDRWSYLWRHATDVHSPVGNLGLDLKLHRVSDDEHWRDFNRGSSGNTRMYDSNDRLIESVGTLRWAQNGHSVLLRAQQWQTLQDLSDASASIAPPFDRLPQLQWRYEPNLLQTTPWGLDWRLEADTTRFRARDVLGRQHRDNGQRTYALAQVSRPWRGAAGFVVPAVQLHSSHYNFEYREAGRQSTESFAIPTFSLDTGLMFERATTLWGRNMLQTLEPRAFYTYTPYRDQSMLPVYDTAAVDFNPASIYSANNYTGHDRIADNHMVTAGVTTRYVDADSGAEVVRLGLAQRLRFEDQRNGVGLLGEKGASDILMGGGVKWNERWGTDALVQYNTDIDRTVRSSISGRYQPGPYRTLSMAYRYQREDSLSENLPFNHGSEQVDFGWQWPIGNTGKASQGTAPGSRWYSVGRLNYSMYDKKLVDAIVGFEYDSCCWIGRVVVERLQNTRTESNTRLLFQLEFVGFSRLSLGANPLASLQSHVPGYRALRENQQREVSRFSNYD